MCVCKDYIYILYIYIYCIIIYIPRPCHKSKSKLWKILQWPSDYMQKITDTNDFATRLNLPDFGSAGIDSGERHTKKHSQGKTHTQIRYFEDLSSMSKLSCSLNVEAFDKMPKPKVVACVLRCICCIELCWLEDPGGLYSFLVSNPMQFKKNVTKQNACRMHCSVRQYSAEVWRFVDGAESGPMVYMLYRAYSNQMQRKKCGWCLVLLHVLKQ